MRTVSGPKQELPCVWELAGVLVQHPCDRDYECESCELYHALCGGDGLPGLRGADVERHRPRRSPDEGEREVEAAQVIARVLGGCRLFLDRWYSAANVWLLPESDGEYWVGLAGCMWKILEPVDEIVPPTVGIEVGRDEPCGWLVRDTLTVPLRLPVPGTVVEVNDALVEEVRRSGSVVDPDAWILRIAAEVEPEAGADLLRGERALAWQLRKIRILKGFVRDALRAEEGHSGPVLADGGVPETDLHRVLGAERFALLVDAVL
jgi:glycine cleavage system H lipoate-binding protein